MEKQTDMQITWSSSELHEPNIQKIVKKKKNRRNKAKKKITSDVFVNARDKTALAGPSSV